MHVCACSCKDFAKFQVDEINTEATGCVQGLLSLSLCEEIYNLRCLEKTGNRIWCLRYLTFLKITSGLILNIPSTLVAAH